MEFVRCGKELICYMLCKYYVPIQVARADKGVSLQQLYCWDCWSELRKGNRFSSLVFVLSCVDSGLCNELITCSGEFYRVCVCVCVCVRARVCV